MRKAIGLRWFVVAAGTAMLLALAAACTETVEVPGETVVVEKVVTETVEVPGETVVVEKIVTETVEVPGETVTKEVVKEVMVPGETVVVEKIVTETVEVPGETVTVEVVKEVQVPGQTVVVEKEVVRTVEVPGQTVVVEKEVVKTVEVPGQTVVVEKIVTETVEVPVEVVKTVIATPGPADTRFYIEAIDPGFKRGGTFVTSNNGPPSHFDYFVSGSITWHGWMTPMYDTLMRRDTRTALTTIVPDLAYAWDVSNGFKTYTFKLREGAKFHRSGAEVTATDVKATYERAAFPAEGLGSSMKSIWDFATLNEINALDTHTVEFKLEEPRGVGVVMSGFSAQDIKILPKTILDEYGGNLREADPLEVSGSGPFIAVSRDDDHVVMDANPDYWNPNAPYVDRIDHIWIPLMSATLTAAVAAGQVDWSMFIPPGDASTLQKIPGLHHLTHVRPSYIGIPFNTTRPPFDDKRVRQAVALVFDQEAISEAGAHVTGMVFGGGWFSEGQGVYSLSPAQLREEKYWRSPTEGDIAEAQKLLADAGYPNGEGIPTLDLLGRGDGPWWQIMLELEQAWLKQHLNIDSNIRLVEVSVWADDESSGNFDIAAEFNSSQSIPVPEFYIKNAFGRCGDVLCRVNYARYDNPELDAMLRTLQLEGDPDKRYDLTVELSTFLSDEMPAVPFSTGEITHHFYYDVVKGFIPGGSSFQGPYITNKWDHVWLDR